MNQMEQLQQLRDRDVERCARATAEAVARAEREAAAVERAARRERSARERLAQAVRDRALRPADEFVRSFVEACEAAYAEAQQLVASARQALAEAQQRLRETRRRWLRAKARQDALAALVQRMRSADRRARDRRLSDEANERTAAAGRVAWA
ncbi:hypothetical protein OK349_04580 [Sphingomonas sp. BT-65]|uniref:hypothetical protein n=1 Tax=Sphingomonas sp. BT-65 TaxID=2989821 RepID=UPI00223549C2|nr:hypothetical protein [Sphingomonas sp. BT-65]MCW4460972.1 hypothetical protein [Sphingomonas sp. BT-65]